MDDRAIVPVGVLACHNFSKSTHSPSPPAQVHGRGARRLLALCRANGGVYVKAGQLASEMSAVPSQYRVALAELQVLCCYFSVSFLFVLPV